MARYQNLSGNSGVVEYEIESDSITVTFHDASIYLYNYSSTGQTNVEQMKLLAHGGQGLNSFINRNVKKAYARKLK